METQTETASNRELTTDEKLDEILKNQRLILSTFEEYRPLLERYKQAAQAGSFMAARRALKEAKNG